MEAECVLTLDKGLTKVSRRRQAEPRKGLDVCVCVGGTCTSLQNLHTGAHEYGFGKKGENRRKLKWNKKEMPSLATQRN